MKNFDEKDFDCGVITNFLLFVVFMLIMLFITPGIFVVIAIGLLILSVFIENNPKYKDEFYSYLNKVRDFCLKTKNRRKLTKNGKLPNMLQKEKNLNNQVYQTKKQSDKHNLDNDFSYSWKSIWDDYESVLDLMEKDK